MAEQFIKEELLFDGNEKQIFSTSDPEKVIIRFKDVATAFNNVKTAVFPGKGRVNNKISTLFFRYLEERGVHTHFIDVAGENEQLCRKSRNIPIELIVRNYIAGSLASRLGILEGMEPATVIYDIHLNRDDLGDPLINDSQAVALGIASFEDLKIMYDIARTVNGLLTDLCHQARLKLIDFRLEFGRDENGKIMLCDEISPDTARFWDEGSNTRLDKDRFRYDLGNILGSYEQVLDRISSVLE